LDKASVQQCDKYTPINEVGGTQGTYGQSINPAFLLGLLGGGTPVYMIVHAKGSDVDYWSPIAESRVSSPNLVTQNLWVYSSDGSRTLRTPVYSELQDFLVVLERREKGDRTEYRVGVLGDNTAELDSVLLTVSRGPSVNLVLESPQVLAYRNIPGVLQLILAGNDSGWEDLSVRRPYIDLNEFMFQLFKDLVSFRPRIGVAVSMVDAFRDVHDYFRDSDQIYPTDEFTRRVRDVNKNHADVYPALRLDWATFGIQFRFTLDDASDKPWLFLQAKNRRGTFIGLEIGPDPAQARRVKRQR